MRWLKNFLKETNWNYDSKVGKSTSMCLNSQTRKLPYKKSYEKLRIDKLSSHMIIAIYANMIYWGQRLKVSYTISW